MRGYGNRRGAGGRQQQPDTTTLLPAALRKELGIEAEDGGGAKHSGRDRNSNSVFGRKDARKDARTASKNPRGGFNHSQNSTLKRKYGDEGQRTPSRAATTSAPPPKKARTVPAPGPNSNGGNSASSKAKGKERVSSKPAIQDPAISKGKQRKHVDAAAQTPLERMLAAQKSNGTSSSSSTMPGDAAPRTRKKRSQMTQAEKDEADEIAWLEAKLKLDREGGDDGEADDGLGVLIRELDRYQTGMFDKPAEDDEDEQDVSEEEDESDEEESSDGDAGEDDLESDEDFELEDGEEIQLNEGADEEEEADAATEEEEEAEQRVEDGKTSVKTAATSSAPSTSGKYIPPALRRAAAEAEMASSSLVKAASSAPTADPKLTRTLNGLLNRLSSANLDAIMADLVETYRSHPRAVVTQTLVRLVLETVALQPDLVDSIVIMYAALFAALGRSVGVEFGAEAVQVLTGKLVHAHAQIRRRQRGAGVAVGADGLDDKAGRECLNLAVLLAHAYNLHLIAAPIVYDVVRLCLREPAAIRAGRDLEAMHLRSTAQQPIESVEGGDEPKVMYEIDVELLLKLVKACGGQMRSDDPSALRDIVSLTQERINDASSQGTSSLGSRSRFMLEALVDLQKARSKPKAGAAAFGADGTVAAEALGRYKKYIAGMVRRPDRLLRSSAASGMGSTDEPLLNIGLRDLADSTRKGRWWLVGAAWTGHDKDDEDDVEPAAEGVTAKRKLAKTGSKGAGDSNSGVVGTSTGTEEANLLILAREHGMNTDARKGVFITLMSSEDYIDASQKLLGLGLNEVQRREVVRVLLHCLGSEPIYNPYYVLIGQQLASDSGAAGGPALATSSTSGVISTRVTMQYCLWDYFREIGESDVGGATMIAGKGDDDGEDGDDFKGFDDVFGETNDGGEGGLASVSRKMIHLARAYGWWIAKNALNLNMLRTVNFAGLKQRGRAFIQLLLVHMLLSIQTASPTKTLTMSWNAEKSASRYRASIENVLVRGTAGNLELARGLLIFVKRYMRPAEVVQVVGGSGIKKGTRQALEWAVKVSEEVLEVGIQVAGQV
ncbi:unnamed protein product [Tilletia controversa]|uniref:MI domain-containing protein n=2 Tax=Tilletia TaxID=13289 RepID=A0A177UWI0_9BASI|nr:hypothetical protein CF336_g5378 [Tilletia laevis]KAE8257545.1 hypothetical protein A4X03_0g4638 [Tilletia caries]CAD6910981.1 unnamed protein product [Tilletia controversa]KAE8197425.1 hypothetical protein CF335_g4616 [Tilletia laevis]CAD6887950.1 unnamed protein product [Tilletia caries]